MKKLKWFLLTVITALLLSMPVLAEEGIDSERTFWDSCSSPYYYNQLTEAQQGLWDLMSDSCYEYLTTEVEPVLIHPYNETNGYSEFYCTPMLEVTDVYEKCLEEYQNGVTPYSIDELAKFFQVSNPQYYYLAKWVGFKFTKTKEGLYHGGVTFAAKSQELAFEFCRDKRPERIRELKAAILKKMESVNQQPTPYLKAAEIVYQIATPAKYNHESMNSLENQSAYSALCLNLTVCMGYTQANTLLCNLAGINCFGVVNFDHAWNVCEINGKFYYTDITNAASMYQSTPPRPDSNGTLVEGYRGYIDLEGVVLPGYALLTPFDERILPEIAIYPSFSKIGARPPIKSREVEYVAPETIATAPSIQLRAVNGGVLVTMSADEGDDIYYSYDVLDTSNARSKMTKYYVPFILDKNRTISAVARGDNKRFSPVTSANAVVEGDVEPVTMEVVNEDNVPYLKASCETQGAKMYYTLDGTKPTINSTEYVGSVELCGSPSIRMFASKHGYKNSPVVSGDYKLTLPALERDSEDFVLYKSEYTFAAERGTKKTIFSHKYVTFTGATTEPGSKCEYENAIVAFQWYRNTTPSTEGGVLLQGQTESTLSFIPNEANVTYYYYYVVTVTKNMDCGIIAKLEDVGDIITVKQGAKEPPRQAFISEPTLVTTANGKIVESVPVLNINDTVTATVTMHEEELERIAWEEGKLSYEWDCYGEKIGTTDTPTITFCLKDYVSIPESGSNITTSIKCYVRYTVMTSNGKSDTCTERPFGRSFAVTDGSVKSLRVALFSGSSSEALLDARVDVGTVLSPSFFKGYEDEKFYAELPRNMYDPGTLYDFSSPVTKNVYIWVREKYTLTFVDGISKDPLVIYGYKHDNIAVPKVGTLNGYEFAGWSTEVNGDVIEIYPEMDRYYPRGDMVLFGSWYKSVPPTPKPLPVPTPPPNTTPPPSQPSTPTPTQPQTPTPTPDSAPTPTPAPAPTPAPDNSKPSSTAKVKIKRVSLISVKSSKKQQTVVKWKVDKSVAGYQVQCSKNKKFSSSTKSSTIKEATKSSVTFKSLKSKTKYYVRVRAYKLRSNKSKVYGSWSNVKTIKVK